MLQSFLDRRLLQQSLVVFNKTLGVGLVTSSIPLSLIMSSPALAVMTSSMLGWSLLINSALEIVHVNQHPLDGEARLVATPWVALT